MQTPAQADPLDFLKALAERPDALQRPESGRPFDLVSDFKPSGDQPAAIEELVAGLEAGERDQVLLGVTGSGKTFTMAHAIARMQRPALVLAPNKILAAQLYGEFKDSLPAQRRRVLRQLLRLLPAGSLRSAHRHLHREDLGDQRADRPDAPLGDPRLVRARRRHHRRLGLLHLRHGLARDLARMTLNVQKGQRLDRQQLLRALVELQYRRNEIGFSRGDFRSKGDTVEVYPAHMENKAWRPLAVRRRGRGHHRVRSAHG